jgi:inhibitor of cysteine peptidase
VGSLLVVVLMKQLNSGTFSVSDSSGQNNTWTIQNGTANYPVKAFAYALNTAGGSTDLIVPTVTGGGTIYYAIGEYSGVNAVRGATIWAENPNSSALTVTTTSIVTTANDLLLGVGTREAAGNDINLSPAFNWRAGTTMGTGTTKTAFGDIAAVGGSQNMTIEFLYFGGIALLDFYQLSTYSISGNAGVAGATVSWSGTASGSTTAAGDGSYIIPSLGAGTYTITPSLAGYIFSPVNQVETISSNVTGVNFTATAVFSISGNAGEASSIVALTSSVEASENFLFESALNANWTPSFGTFGFNTGTATPCVKSLAVTSIYGSDTRAAMSYNGTWNQNQSSSVTMLVYCIDEDYDSIGPAVNITGSNGTATYYGFYQCQTLATCYLTRVVNDVVISYQSAAYSGSAGDVVTLNYNNGVLTGSINGVAKITWTDVSPLPAGNPGICGQAFYTGPTDLPDTRVSSWFACNGAPTTATADGSGAYTFTGLVAGTYVVTPSLNPYSFAPASRQETIVSSNITGVNFTATLLPVTTPGISIVTGTATVTNQDSPLTGYASYYTLDGSTPTTGSTHYTTPVTMTRGETIKVLSVVTGLANSAIASAALLPASGFDYSFYFRF